MLFDTGFAGRILQVTEALSYDDAVSNQVLALDGIFAKMGFRSEVYTKFHDSRHEGRRQSIDEMVCDDGDVLVYHFYGRATYTLPIVLNQYCTRVLLYHNITPHHFFPASAHAHDFCKWGRDQLRECIKDFNFYWADSHFNLDELMELGAPRERCSVVPIVVPGAEMRNAPARESGSWLFVGRCAPNKCQIKLVNFFHAIRSDNPALATELHLVGGYDEKDEYYRDLLNCISEMGLGASVKVYGKVSESVRNSLYETASVYVSLSEHEGFGVPLIEAAVRGMPVLALGTSAVSETLGFSIGVASDVGALKTRFRRVMSDDGLRADLLAEQRANARRFNEPSVAEKLGLALMSILPTRRQFRRISVVVCTYNRAAYLSRLLEYFSHQSCSDFEIIVVDGPSSDGTKDVVSGYRGAIKLAKNPIRNLAMSRNIGIEISDGDIIAFVDDDALPFDNWIENILASYNSRPLTTAGVGGPAYYAGTFWFQAEDNGINRFGEAKVSIPSDNIGKDGWYRYNTGTNATFSAAILRGALGFDEQFDYFLDESEVCFRLQSQGWLIAYCSCIVVRHEFAQSHNRLGNLNYNWHTICKNTVYFICAYSGLKEEERNEYIRKRMETERVGPLRAALDSGTLGAVDFDRHIAAIWEGVKVGISDAKNFPKTRSLIDSPGNFLPFPISGDFPSFGAGRKRLHIAIVSKEFPPFAPGGGVGTLYYHLASELLMMGNQVTVLTPGDNAHEFKQGDMTVHFVPITAVAVAGAESGFARNISWSVSALNMLAEIHKKNPIHVVDSALWDCEALALALLPSRARPPVVVRLVTPYLLASKINQWAPPAETALLFSNAERALIEHADAVVPISESIAGSIEKIYGITRGDRWRRIPCGIAYWPFFDVNSGYDDIPELKGLSRGVLESENLLVFVGRLETRKGIDLVFQAANRFLLQYPQAHLVIAGKDVEGWCNRIESLVADSVRARVHLLGEVTEVVRNKLLSRAYAVIFPSRYESFGLVPLEAFVHGTPVVASNGGAIPEVVEHGISGLLFTNEDSLGLAEAVDRLLGDRELRHSLSIGASRRVRQLSSRVSANKTMALYCQLIDQRHRLQ